MGELYNPFPKLPKNIRQIGDSDQVVRFYMEDYVNTYLKRLYPGGRQTLRVGVLLGSVEQYDGMPYIFVDGAMEIEDVEVDGEKVLFSESSWKKVYRQMEESFPKRTVQGWFLCGGPESQLSPLNYWKQHNQYFAGKNQLMYLNHALEGEEAIYITSEDGFYRLKGHSIYYERNQMMQDYMITRKDVRRVESGAQETVIRDFRARLSAKKEQASRQSRANHAIGMLCGILTIAVLAGGAALVNNYTKMQKMESVLASVLPAGSEYWEELRNGKNRQSSQGEQTIQYDQYDENMLIIEEIKGTIRPTAAGISSEESDADESMKSGEEQETAQPLVGIDKETGSEADQESTVEAPISVTDPSAGTMVSSSLQPDYNTASAQGYKIYEVGKGETLYGICWKTYSSLEYLEEICQLNHLTDVDRILAGQKLILP